MIYGYVSVLNNSAKEVKSMIEDYANNHHYKLDDLIEDRKQNNSNWKTRDIYNLLKHKAQPGDELIVYEATNIARSKTGIIDVMQLLIERDITLHFVKYNRKFKPAVHIDEHEFIEIIQMIDSDFYAREAYEKLCKTASD